MSNGHGGNGVYLARFFQVAYVTRDLDRAALTFQRRGEHPMVLQGSVEGFLSYVYVDARNETGHYLEYILCEPAGQAYFDAVPRS